MHELFNYTEPVSSDCGILKVRHNDSRSCVILVVPRSVGQPSRLLVPSSTYLCRELQGKKPKPKLSRRLRLPSLERHSTQASLLSQGSQDLRCQSYAQFRNAALPSYVGIPWKAPGAFGFSKRQ